MYKDLKYPTAYKVPLKISPETLGFSFFLIPFENIELSYFENTSQCVNVQKTFHAIFVCKT